jgi:hypothetical protein
MNEIEIQSGLLVVRRLNWQTDLPIDDPVFEADINEPTIPLSHEEIRNRYRGFEGWPWPDCPGAQRPPLADGLAAFSDLSTAEQYYKAVSKLYPCDLLYLNAGRNQPLSDFRFLGYDYGYYLSEGNYFSSLLNEVIYGIHDEMTRYAEFLNYDLLLPDLALAKRVHDTRTDLLQDTEASLERDGEIFAPITIYGFPQL